MLRMRVQTRLALGAVLALTGGLVGAPGAGAEWTDPQEISPAGTPATEPQVAVDGAGNATVVWTAGAGRGRSGRPSGRRAARGRSPSTARPAQPTVTTRSSR